jgi:hypothetical protein
MRETQHFLMPTAAPLPGGSQLKVQGISQEAGKLLQQYHEVPELHEVR